MAAEDRSSAMPDPSSVQDVFDVRKVRRLVELMKEYDLAEMDLKQGETRIQLRRGGAAAGAVVMPPAAPATVQAPAAAEKAAPAAAAAEPSNIKLITSPMVGTFYSAADPQSPPFVKVGDHVGPDTTVCIVEAMRSSIRFRRRFRARSPRFWPRTGRPSSSGSRCSKWRWESSNACFKGFWSPTAAKSPCG